MDVFNALGYTMITGRTKVLHERKHIGITTASPISDYDTSFRNIIVKMPYDFNDIYENEIFKAILTQIRVLYPDYPADGLDFQHIKKRMQYIYSKDWEDYDTIERNSGIDIMYGALTTKILSEIIGTIKRRYVELNRNTNPLVLSRNVNTITEDQSKPYLRNGVKFSKL